MPLPSSLHCHPEKTKPWHVGCLCEACGSGPSATPRAVSGGLGLSSVGPGAWRSLGIPVHVRSTEKPAEWHLATASPICSGF